MSDSRTTSLGDLARQWARSALRFGNGVLGADKYERYLDYHRASGQAGEPMTEREFWKDYQDWQDANPQGRCC